MSLSKEELRIGNLVKLGFLINDSERLCVIDEIKRKDCTLSIVHKEGDKFANGICDNIPFDKIAGIPLTPELLEKCGFRWIETPPYRPGFYGPMVNGWKMRLWQNDEHDYIFSINEYNAIGLFYLHDLQNLFYSFHRKELEVNL